MNGGHELVEQVYAAKTDPDAADSLIRQYMGFLRAETAKYLHRAPIEGQDEELSIVLLAFYEAILGYEKNRGKGGALREGVMAANGDKIIFTDSDLAYGLKHLQEFSNALDSSEIVIGTRRQDKNINESYGIKRNISSRLFSKCVQLILGLNISDTQCGFKGYREKTAKMLFRDLEIYGFGFDLEILAKAKAAGIQITQLPVVMENNSANSNVGLISDGIKMIFDMFKIKKIVKRIHN